ncbi:MAG: DUF255 domain-containing protein [Vicinamibacterales bacterium]
MAAIAWLPWSADAFARARTEHKPVLLSIVATWCSHSAEMDRTSYADPDVAALVADRFIPVRVDADRRPDVGLRYGLGGWPTTAFLTPDGRVLGGGTYVGPERLPGILQRVFDAFATGRYAAPPSTIAAPEPSSPAPDVDRLVGQVVEAFDPDHGGFGGAPKFPHVAPIRLALDLYREQQEERFREIAVTSLDAMGWSALYDERDGGFFRCCQDRGWERPSAEKLLEVNAALLALYVEAFEALALARYAERAEDILRYVQTWLADPVDGGWAGSQRADSSYDEHSAHDEADRAGAPWIDRTLYVDWNAAMVSAALSAGRRMNDAALSEFAIKSLERLTLLCYRPGAGIAHYFDGLPRLRGLLDDQVATATANLDAFDATGNIVYEMMAEELALHAIRTLWDDQAGGFFDRAGDEQADVGLLRERVKPFIGNCASARMLVRLARTSHKDTYAAYAARALAAMSTRAAAEGPLAAEYLLAVRACEER